MKYGLIGERLGHSFSKEIHESIADYTYELVELRHEEVGAFLKKADFQAINVTIPYKETVIPYLSEIDDAAREIGAVNCILNQEGRLYGYNTDFYGMRALILHAGISLSGRVCAILGTGGTSKTARAVARSLGAVKIYVVSRSPVGDEISYERLYEIADEVEVIINTTPVGMYPNTEGAAVEVSSFKSLAGVIDAVYNPNRTRLIMEARRLGIPAEGGLYMLVAQAVRAIEIFCGKALDGATTDRIYSKIAGEKENIVLIGMPSSGKTTIGKIIGERLGRELIDTDEMIVDKRGMEIPEIFKSEGEAMFREYEAEAVAEASRRVSLVIATGGGAVLRGDNVERLRRNGRIYFIDRPLEDLIPTQDRPLSQTREDVEKRYKERYQIYIAAADVRIDGKGSANEVAERILTDFNENLRY